MTGRKRAEDLQRKARKTDDWATITPLKTENEIQIPQSILY